MENVFVNILFGHLVGDFVLQNKWMAVNKSASSLKCLVHCLLYTISMVLFTSHYNLLWILIVFGTHFLIDRFSLADYWLLFIEGRALKDFLKNGLKDIPEDEANPDTQFNYHVLRGGFTSIVYTVVDNTFHLLIAYYAYSI